MTKSCCRSAVDGRVRARHPNFTLTCRRTRQAEIGAQVIFTGIWHGVFRSRSACSGKGVAHHRRRLSPRSPTHRQVCYRIGRDGLCAIGVPHGVIRRRHHQILHPCCSSNAQAPCTCDCACCCRCGVTSSCDRQSGANIGRFCHAESSCSIDG